MKPKFFALPLLLACGGAYAGSFELSTLQNLSQSEFRQLSEDLGAAVSYKPLAPADSLGPLGFDVGLAMSATRLANTAAEQKAISGSSVFNTLPVPSLRAIKGLPYNIDVGVEYARIPSSGINLYGAEIKWAFLPGSIALPALALRGSFTRLNGISQLGFETAGVDLSISKGFAFLTPYAGLGQVRSRSATDGLALSQVNLTQSKYFAGVDANLGLGNLVFEADSTGGIHTYSLKAGLRF